MDALIPDGLAQGLLGYAYTCPDMIGGEYLSFTSAKLDPELFVRSAQCSALFPMMQFSAAPWRVLDDEYLQYCVEAAQLHARFGPEILELARQSAQTGEPILRHMAYEFPDEGMETIQDQFMLGRSLLVAPAVLLKAAFVGIQEPDANGMTAVRVWKENKDIPTYGTGEPDKNPMFLDKRVYQGSSGRVYPHPVIDKIEDDKKLKSYRLVILENDYVRIEIMPEIGGRIYRALDKTNNYDFV